MKKLVYISLLLVGLLTAAEFDITLPQRNASNTNVYRTVSPTASSLLGVDSSRIPTSFAISGFEVPITAGTGLTRTVNTFSVNTTQNITTLSNLTGNGFVKTSGGVGTLSVDTNTYLTGNQTITLSGDVSGSGSTAITTTIGNNKVTGAMIAYGSDAQGDVAYYNGTDWARLGAGTDGDVLRTQGAGANPQWDATSSGAVGSSDAGKLVRYRTGGILAAVTHVTGSVSSIVASLGGGGITFLYGSPAPPGPRLAPPASDPGAIVWTLPSGAGTIALTNQIIPIDEDGFWQAEGDMIQGLAPGDAIRTPLGTHKQVWTVNGFSGFANWEDPPLKAWINFDGGTADNLACTYSRTGTTVTVSSTAHGHIVGHVVQIDFTSGGALDGTYTIVSVPDADSYTVTTVASGTISAGSTMNELRRSITASSGVHSVSYLAVGTYWVNFTADLGSAAYSWNANVNTLPASNRGGGFAGPSVTADMTSAAIKIYARAAGESVSTATNSDFAIITLSIFK